MLSYSTLALGTGVALHPQGSDWTRLGPYAAQFVLSLFCAIL